MNRREFIVTAAGTLCAPLAVWAQQPGRLFRTGWLDYSSAAENLGIFVQAMSGRGWVQDKNFRIEYRGGEGKAERLEAVAAELVRLPADIIIAPGTPEALAARKATQAIPIVMAMPMSADFRASASFRHSLRGLLARLVDDADGAREDEVPFELRGV